MAVPEVRTSKLRYSMVDHRGVRVAPATRFALAALALGLCFFAVTARAQIQGGVPPVEESSSDKMAAEALLGFGLLGEDYFLMLAPGASFQFGKFGFGVHVPLRIRVVDNHPEDSTWYRKEDWDEVSDWTRLLRYFQYGLPEDPLYVRAGELSGSSVGHGTLVHRYYNTLELDHYHTGLATKVNLEKGGGEFLTNEVLAWNLVALRGYVAPFALLMDEPGWFLKRIRFGASFAADFQAPLTIRENDQGLSRLGSADQLQFDAGTAWLWGVDVELAIVSTSTASVVPYMDLNGFRGQGIGWHLGILNGFRAAGSEFEFRLEYRLLGAGYAPSYFNTLYDLERFQYRALSAGTEVVPKYRFYRDAELAMRSGVYGELYANILGLVGVGGSYEDYQGPQNSSITLRADLPAIAGVKVAGYYARRNFEGLGQLFSLDDAFAVLEARVTIASPLFLYGIYSVYWRLVADETSSRHGEYETTDNFQFGAGVAFSF
jgi:hypothetical protein